MKLSVFDIDNWREIGATLARNKTRTFLTAFGIFWGTAMLAILWGGGDGLRAALSGNFEGFASNCAIVFSGRTTMPYNGYKKGTYWNLRTSDIDRILLSAPEIENVVPSSSASATMKYRDKTTSGQIEGYGPEFVALMNPVIRKGRFINDADVASRAKVCVIGESAASKLFGVGDPLGQFVEVDNIFYRVVGVVKSRNMIKINGPLDDNIVVPISTLMSIYNRGTNVGATFFIVRPGYTPADIKDKVWRAIRAGHPMISPDDDTAISMWDISEQFKMVDNMMTGVNVLLLFVGFSSLLAGIIGVGNIMWIIVKERTHEFGIRRALGARPATVLRQILSESAVLTVIAGTGGIVFAVAMLGAANLGMEAAGQPAEFQLTFSTAISILFIFLILGMAAGTIPALKAMKIKPIEALNDK